MTQLGSKYKLVGHEKPKFILVDRTISHARDPTTEKMHDVPKLLARKRECTGLRVQKQARTS